MSGHWDIDGVFIGAIDGEPVNCRLRARELPHGVEVWIKAVGVNRESVTSRAPEVMQLFHGVKHEFHCAAAQAGTAPDPVPPILAGPHLTYFPGCLAQDRAVPELQSDVPGLDRVRANRR